VEVNNDENIHKDRWTLTDVRPMYSRWGEAGVDRAFVMSRSSPSSSIGMRRAVAGIEMDIVFSDRGLVRVCPLFAGETGGISASMLIVEGNRNGSATTGTCDSWYS
jgi:hypothetical protein